MVPGRGDLPRPAGGGTAVSRLADLHNDWLLLVDPQGPFLTLPVLKERLPQGLDRVEADTRAAVREAWEEAAGSDDRREWVWWLLREVLGWRDDLIVEDIPSNLVCPVPEYELTLRPDGALIDPENGDPLLLVTVLPPGTDPSARGREGWAATYIQRAARLGRHVGCPLALVTDGDLFTLVHAPVGGATSWATWRASWFSSEPILLESFVTLLGARRFFTLAEDETLAALFSASASAEAEVTEALGSQVRQAVELLVSAISRADRNRRGRLLDGIAPEQVYDAAASVLMRMVFLLAAEENRLLPLDNDLYARSYALSTLRAQLEDDELRHREQMEYRTTGWHRILALSRAVHEGVSHEDLNIPAYGGGLFDPDRFPFLEGRRLGQESPDEAEPLPVDDLTVLEILRALQVLRFRHRNVTETRQLSFKSLSVEQIGHVYERLLDHGTRKADQVVLGLVGRTAGEEPEVPLADLEALDLQGRSALVTWLASKEVTAKTTRQIERLLDRPPSPELRKALRVACDNDEALVKRILPYVNLLRLDLRGIPMVFLPGSHYVTKIGSRREGGIEYTPRELADEVVEHALAPLCYSPGPAETASVEEWRIRPSDEILDLKVCDPACGSGAFLVAAVRYLADRLIEAWEAEGVAEVDPSTAADDPSQLDLTVRARRLIVERCIYGVDRDAMAVEMAKLSLWLVTMAKDQPFTFLDHAIKGGDSLLGITDLDQLRYFHLDPAEGRRLHSTFVDPTEVIDPAIKDAIEIRRRLQAIEVRSVRDANTKAALLREAEDRLESLRAIGDHLVAATLSTATDGKLALENRLLAAAEHVVEALDGDPEDLGKLQRRTQEWLDAGRPPGGPPRPPFHWPLAFPEVFLDRPAGRFDAVIGNPPFLGGKRISGPMGQDYREYLVAQIAGGTKGNADLVAFFFLRAAQIARQFGLLATNTISQGDTREVGLDQLTEHGWTIYRAVKSTKWPGEASLEIAKVWATKDDWSGCHTLDGLAVRGITPTLDPASRVSGNPERLAANAGRSFIGSYVLGMGFTITPEEAAGLIDRDPRNSEVLFPYLNGDDLNSHPRQQASRWIVNFFDWPEDQARRYPDCFALLEERVKPERMEKDARKYPRMVEEWWQYWNIRHELYSAISGLDRVLVIALTSKVVQPVFVPNGQVYSHALGVFAYNDDGHFGVLSSGFHWWWASTRASTMRTDIRYTPTDCFETFPQPQLTAAIEEAGRALNEHRAASMIENDEGLTKTYNRVHDPDDDNPGIVRLRQLHVSLDEAVADAYGWSDLDLGHGHHDTPWGTRFTFQPSVRQEILDRLLELNHQRYQEEVRQGLHDKPRRRSRSELESGPKLFEDEE